MKLTARFFASHALAVLVAAAGSAAVMHFGARYLMQREALERRQQAAQALAAAARETALHREVQSVSEALRGLARDPLVAFAAYGGGGMRLVLPLSARDHPLAAAPVRGGAAARAEDGGLEVWTVAVEPGAWVKLAWRQDALRADLDAKMARWLWLSVAAGAAALALGALLALWLARSLVAPLTALRQGTRQVRQGRLDSLVQVERGDEIGDLARDFNAMTRELKELDEMKRNFVSGVTHDLATPLYAIRSAVSYLQEGHGGRLTRVMAEYLLMVSNSAEQLTGFIQNLLTTARIEAGKQEPYAERFDAWEVVEDCARLFRPKAREGGVTLAARCDARPSTMVADMGQFRQMVMNLVSNAVKFTPKGRVEVALSREAGFLVLKVADSGIGIDPSHHGLIFDRFYRVRQPKGAPAPQGSGLGLFIVRGLAEANGGSVTVESSLGKGSTFTLRLPDLVPSARAGRAKRQEEHRG